jgi:intracellular sulfur oxidation DsrE/DsrF family protein
MTDGSDSVARRSMLSRLGIGVAALGAGVAATRAEAATNQRFQPAQHPEDDWFDQLRGSHRFLIDSTTPDGGGGALAFAGNYFVANKNGYRLDPSALAVVIVLRHFSTPFAYTDAIWTKYSRPIFDLTKFTDPKTMQPAKTNLYNSAAYGLTLPNFGTTIDSLLNQGVHFAVCDMATHFFAGHIAEQTKGNADAVYRELTANLIRNAHLVPAGIVAVNRAQEHGYSFAYAA